MKNDLAIAIFSEVLAIDQRLRTRLSKALPKGLELSHFSVLNHLFATTTECTPASLATSLHVSRGAISNTLTRLEKNGYIHIRGDWDDARKKYITLSAAGKLAREMAIKAVDPVFNEFTDSKQPEQLKEILSSLRSLRQDLG